MGLHRGRLKGQGRVDKLNQCQCGFRKREEYEIEGREKERETGERRREKQTINDREDIHEYTVIYTH